MPAAPGSREQLFIERFVSAYENCAWAGSAIRRLDEEEDGAVEALITRADGQTMAIEHTLIEPFVGDKRDFAMFEKALLGIENDKFLAVPDTAVWVYVPVGVLKGRKQAEAGIVGAIHVWIKKNRLKLLEGQHEYPCDLPGLPPVTLTVKRSKFGSSRPRPGCLLVRRQPVVNDLDKVIEKALHRKLPKLVNTKADRHLLFLERDQIAFRTELIFAEIERQRPNFPALDKVDEIWHVETVNYDRDDCLNFELWKGDQELASLGFHADALLWSSRNGASHPANPREDEDFTPEMIAARSA